MTRATICFVLAAGIVPIAKLPGGSGGGFPGGFPTMPGFGGPPPQPDLRDRLAELAELHSAGTLSDAEFEVQTEELMNEAERPRPAPPRPTRPRPT